MKTTCSIMLCAAVIGLLLLAGCRQQSEPNASCPTTDVISSVSDSQTNDFLGSSTYATIENIIWESFSNASPSIKYDAANGYLELCLTAPPGTAQSIVSDADAISASWNEYTTALDRFCESMYQSCIDTGYMVGCGLMVCSDANPDNVLYATLNGVTYYDAVEEAQKVP